MAHQQNSQQYYRADSSDSAACMLGPQGSRGQEEEPGAEGQRTKAKKSCSPVWPAMTLMAILALQIASTTGLFVYFTMSISKLKAQTQGTSEELKCLQFINALEEMADPVATEMHELFMNEPCQRMANSIRSYVTMVAENSLRNSILKEASRRYSNSSEFQIPSDLSSKPSAHLTLRDHTASHHGSTQGSHGFGGLHTSCRHPIRRWEEKNIWSHRQNISYHEGKLKIAYAGKYYVYSQIYFRYPHQSEPAAHAVGQQLVQCIHKKTSYVQPILLLKGVGTKCWAPNAEYGLHSVHQAGVFQLGAGDELFVSVSSLALVDPEETASYFGMFKLDA